MKKKLIVNARYNASERGKAIHREVSKRYYQRNKEKINGRTRDWQKGYYARPAVAEAKRAYRRQYMQQPEVKLRYRVKNAARDKRIRDTGDGTVTLDAVEELYFRQGGLCALTGRELLGRFHIDHKIPLSKGGRHTISNIQILAPEINIAKGAKLSFTPYGQAA